jgi:phytoene dehydrogenase-like protein
MFIDTGARPDRASFMLTASVFRGMAMEGASYPRGSASTMASALIPVIEQHGGRVLVNAEVDTILFDKGRVSGVKLRNGDEIHCRKVVSSCGFHNTFQRLVPESVTLAHEIPRQLDVPDSAGFVMCNIGIAATPDEVGATSANSWFVPVNERTDLFPPLREFFEKPLEKPMPCFITFPSIKDTAWREKNPCKTSCQVLVMAHYDWFQDWANQPSGKRGQQYEALKEQWKQRCLEAVYRMYPLVKGKVNFVDVSTPLSIEHYLRAPNGGAVGLDVTPERFCDWKVQRYLDVVTTVPGLYLTGQDTLICGVTLCQLAGVITAIRITGILGLVKILAQAIFMV